MAAVLLAKLAGSLLILGATSYGGWQVAGEYSRRPRQLHDLQTALAVLQTEVEYGATPLPDALATAARAAGPQVGALLLSAAGHLQNGAGLTAGDALRTAVAERAPALALRPADWEALLALAAVLGASGREDQVRHLQLARERLAGEEARAIEERARYERVARYAGVLGGAALVLILL